MRVIETNRFNLRHFGPGDAGFILQLVTDPAWRHYIGDRGIETVEQATGYIEDKLIDLYRRLGFGLYCVERKTDLVPIGMCGLVRRDWLEDADLGFAFLPEHRGMGYALESASAVLEWARRDLGLARLAAISTPDNAPARKLLEALGFQARGTVRPAPDEPELRLFEWVAGTGSFTGTSRAPGD